MNILSAHNPFFQQAGETRPRWPGGPFFFYGMAVTGYSFTAVILSQLTLLPIFLLYAFTRPNITLDNLLAPSSAIDLTIQLIGGFLPLFFFVWLWLIIFERRGLRSVGMGRENAIWQYGRGLLVGLLMFGGVVLILAILGFVTIEQPFSLASTGGALLLFLGWMVQGAAEEVLTRGLLLQVIGKRFNVAAGVVVSTAVFGILHLANANVGPIAIANLLLVGVFFALYTLYEGQLWGVFAIHSVWNWAQGNLFGFQVSGNVIQSAIIIDLMETGPDVVTGGLFGPEGGLAVTAVLLLACLTLLWLARRKKSSPPHPAAPPEQTQSHQGDA